MSATRALSAHLNLGPRDHYRTGILACTAITYLLVIVVWLVYNRVKLEESFTFKAKSETARIVIKSVTLNGRILINPGLKEPTKLEKTNPLPNAERPVFGEASESFVKWTLPKASEIKTVTKADQEVDDEPKTALPDEVVNELCTLMEALHIS
ncbi:hypothetical protein VTI74DRAFT_6825 [Chaetomium olivicolor]